MANLQLQDIEKAFGSVKVIKGVNLTVNHGEFCVFVGPSGCGKSTLLRMISGLDSVSGGRITIDGDLVNDVAAADRGLSMVFQSYALYPHMSVRQNLSFGLENLNTPRDVIKKKIDEVATMLQIHELLDRKPKDLSGGQRQRVAIGRAVVREPRIFLFDEPLSNLDAELRVDMRGEIAQLHKRLGNTMIYVTHDQVEAMTMADKIAVLRAGVVEQFGAPLELYHSPVNQFVAGFIGSPKMNFLNAQVVSAANGKVSLGAGRSIILRSDDFMLSDDAVVVAGIRPNAVRVAESAVADFTVEISGVERLGGESYLYTKTRDGSPVTVNIQGETSLEPGQEIGLSVDVEKVHLFDSDTGATLHR
ncbi:ABC transporter ATP-binding protein [Granulosicoccus antarcticus]|uniref:Maltose/maltodextrin import ATP-binding protein MalK n=1 Tax=Granulosicoccus antarcticus IMCC3135 TaxID=1192854 RepID=A0A2Z2NQE2_9GAMM|nr:sn-glycerol-3-phosphate ABC transporter ATP-binding protein UgpC [Granulosicoccus antarcticus]ASJ72695.1 Maltose/maltodextrin import ATP-binding protein MalK [Granulosicoccus antarcticus IMCC3135]